MRNWCELRSMMVMVVLATGLMSGCATSKGSTNVVSPYKDGSQLAKYNELVVQVDAKEDIILTAEGKERIQKRITKFVKEDSPQRFKEINPATPGPSTLLTHVLIKRYDSGNAFARLMLAGLGQMHIDADVCVSDLATKEEHGRCEVTKTFAWGGLYGGATRIEDLEDGFSEAVAAFILGEPAK